MIISGVGRLGRDGELRYTPNGIAVVNLAIAFNYGQKQDDGNRLSQWIECALWGKQAEALAQYLKKGNQVSVTAADPHIEFFQRTDLTQGTKLVANIINIELIGSKKEEAEPKENTNSAQNKQSAPQQNSGSTPPVPPNYDYFDDDIPF